MYFGGGGGGKGGVIAGPTSEILSGQPSSSLPWNASNFQSVKLGEFPIKKAHVTVEPTY